MCMYQCHEEPSACGTSIAVKRKKRKKRTAPSLQFGSPGLQRSMKEENSAIATVW